MKRKIIVLLLSIVLFLTVVHTSQTVFAQDISLPSGLTLDEVKTGTKQYIKENNPHNAALAFSVISEKGVLYESISGYADKEENLLANTDTIYEWGSLTKVLTWISVMQLYEQGKIDLTEDINVYLPEGFLKKLSHDSKITILDLMNHTAGWQDSITNVYTDDTSDILPLETYLTRYEPIQLYQPGTTVAYSNWGVTLAGYIIEQVSDEDYCDYVMNHIFLPLGMTQTSIHPLHEDNNLVLEGLKHITGYTTTGKNITGHYYAPGYPAASAAGTLRDVELLTQALLMQESSPLFSNIETLQKMFTVTYQFAGTEISENAHGLWFDFYQTPTLGHYGNTPQFSTHIAISPEKHIGMIVMTNQAQETALNFGLGNFVFGEYQADQTEHHWNELKFNKFYVGARTIKKGYCSFYNFFQTYQIKKTGINEIQIGSPFIKLNCTRISEQTYIVNDGLLKGYQIYIDVDDNYVVQKLSTSTFDIIPRSSASVILDWISFSLAGIALLLALTAFILSIRNLCKKKDSGNRFPLVMSSLSLLFFLSGVLEAAKLMTTAASTKDILPFVLFYDLYLLAGVGYIIYYCRTKKKDFIKIAELFSCIILILFILYWQLIWI